MSAIKPHRPCNDKADDERYKELYVERQFLSEDCEVRTPPAFSAFLPELIF
jgi:hypothetical protein